MSFEALGTARQAKESEAADASERPLVRSMLR